MDLRKERTFIGKEYQSIRRNEGMEKRRRKDMVSEGERESEGKGEREEEREKREKEEKHLAVFPVLSLVM